MAEKDLDAKEIEAKVHDLAEAMDRMKGAQASRDDVVVDMKRSQRARLELLAKNLQPVFDKVPDDNEQFEFALTNGEPPRLWIDMTTHVRMGRDRRQYELVKATRMGRVILDTSDDLDRAAQAVTDYVAERMLERERMIEGDWIAMRGYDFDGGGAVEPIQPVASTRSRWRSIAWFVFGLLAGAGALFAWAWYGTIPTFLQ